MISAGQINPQLNSLGGSIKRWVGEDALAVTMFDHNTNEEHAFVGVLVVSGDVEDLTGKKVNFSYGLDGTQTATATFVLGDDDWHGQYGWLAKPTYYARAELPGQHIRGMFTAKILP
jgi:hypothetical protein